MIFLLTIIAFIKQ